VHLLRRWARKIDIAVHPKEATLKEEPFTAEHSTISPASESVVTTKRTITENTKG